jgi:TetR/AcrR family transcriptional regulator, fatty acid metabolism regulator protein
MRTNREGDGGAGTFTQRKRREQLIECVIDAVVERGFQGASVGEVAQRAGVSKGVVTYHFAAKDDLIFAAVARIFDSITEALETRLRGTSPERFVADYINAWVDYYGTETRYMLAIREIWGNFRNEGGQQHFGPQAVAGELGVVRTVLEYGQAQGILGKFDARVMAASIKATLDALLEQFAIDPQLDLEAYGAELVRLFERATRPVRRSQT